MKWIVMTLAIGVLVVSVFGQAAQTPPKPGPEHKWMDYFVGRWAIEGEIKGSPFGPAGRFTSTEDAEWAPGGLFLLMHWDWKGPDGQAKGLTVMGYNATQKVYFSRSFDFTNGGAWGFSGPAEGDTLTFTNEFKEDGKLVKRRYVSKRLSSTSFSVTMEYSIDGGPWSTTMEGRGIKLP